MRQNRINVSGFKEFRQKLRELPEDVKKQAILRVLKKAAQPTLVAAKSEAPIQKQYRKGAEQHNLRKSIGFIEGKRGQSKINPTIYIGPQTKGSNDGWYGAIVHGGRNIYRKGYKREHKRDSVANQNNAVKFVEGDPFLTRAYDKTKKVVAKKSRELVAKEIQKVINSKSK